MSPHVLCASGQDRPGARPRILGRRSVVLLALCACVVAACERGGERIVTLPDDGVRFELPDGWSELSRSERDAFGAQPGQTFVGSADRDRRAFVQRGRFSARDVDATRLLGPSWEPRLALLTASVEKALPERYRDFRLERRGLVSLGGVPAGELVFTGREAGEPLRWRRLLLSFPYAADDATYLLFGYGCPASMDRERCLAGLATVESSWTWE